jgi:hypothetical protein
MSTKNCHIEKLPVEVMDKIARLLKDKPLNNLYMTSKTIRKGTRLEFGRRHFTKRNHLMTSFGLESLVAITNDPFYGGCIRAITFNVSTDLSDPENDACFATSIRDVFSNITRLQAQHQHNITIGFSDNYPRQRRKPRSDAMYQIAEKPSYGWYTLLLKHEISGDFPLLDEVNLLTMGDVMQRVLPLAIASGCRIAGLDIRFVGRLLETQRRLCVHQPCIETLLRELKLPAAWDMKFSIVDYDRTHISTIQFTGHDQKLKFDGFLLGNLDISQVGNEDIYAYHIVSEVLPGRFRQLELVDCSVEDTNHLATQFEELGYFGNSTKYNKSYLALERLAIRGLWIHNDLGWGHVFSSISEVGTLKRCSIQDLQLEPPRHADDEEDGEEGGEEDGHQEDGGEENGNGSANEHDVEDRVARLGRMLADTHIELDTADGHDIAEELLKVSASFGNSA